MQNSERLEPMRGSPEDRAQRKHFRGLAEFFGKAINAPAVAVDRLVAEQARRQETLNALSKLCTTDELEALGRIVAYGTPLWQIERLAMLLPNRSVTGKDLDNAEQ